MSESLNFQEFPIPSREDWLERLSKELKGADIIEKLHWTADQNVKGEPFYQKSADTESSGSIHELLKRDQNSWEARSFMSDSDPIRIRELASEAASRDMAAIEIELNNSIQLEQLDSAVNLHFFLSKAEHFSTSSFPQKSKCYWDILKSWAQNGGFNNNEEADRADFRSFLDQNKTVLIDTAYLADAGAFAEQQLAFSISKASDYLHETENPSELRWNFRMASGSDYFLEIAKFRALRILWANLLEQGNFEVRSMSLMACNSNWNMIQADVNNNLLRQSTQAMSAVLGGADSLSLGIYNKNSGKSSSVQRISDNIQLLLKHESHLDHVVDPAAGSWYLEKLTQDLVRSAWNQFLQIEEKGGFEKALFSGYISEQILESQQAKSEALKNQNIVLVGLNMYADQKSSPQEANPVEKGKSFEPIKNWSPEKVWAETQTVESNS
jgi:methylmalonyl-CoA mutase